MHLFLKKEVKFPTKNTLAVKKCYCGLGHQRLIISKFNKAFTKLKPSKPYHLSVHLKILREKNHTVRLLKMLGILKYFHIIKKPSSGETNLEINLPDLNGPLNRVLPSSTIAAENEKFMPLTQGSRSLRQNYLSLCPSHGYTRNPSHELNM